MTRAYTAAVVYSLILERRDKRDKRANSLEIEFDARARAKIKHERLKLVCDITSISAQRQGLFHRQSELETLSDLSRLLGRH